MKRSVLYILALLAALAILLRADLSSPAAAQAPRPSDPPSTLAAPGAGSRVYLPLATKPMVRQEWELHKTPDGAHPDGNEQQLVWLMNRARANPTAEGLWLATTAEPDIAGGRDYFRVNLGVLQSEFAGYAAKPPAAFDVRLYNAARLHSEDLIARDAQDHNNQFQRIVDSGFKFWGGRGNVFSYASSSLNAHGAFNIDWGGNDGTGMQTGRGHRMAIMSVDGNYTNVGIAMVRDDNPATRVGPLVTTENFCEADPNYPNHYNRFIVGTVWRDVNANARYDPGEGIGGVRVEPDLGSLYAVTAVGGGYAIPAPSPGLYTLTFSGAAQGVRTTTVGAVSVLVDLQMPVGADAQVSPDNDDSASFVPAEPPPGIRFSAN